MVGPQPIGRYLADDYRRVLNTNDSPSFVDTDIPILPVAVVNLALPSPSASQRILTYMINKAGSTSGQTQLFTNTSSLRYKFLGITCSINTGAQIVLFDAVSGTSSGADTSTNLYYFQDSTGVIAIPPVVQTKDSFNGIRLDWSVNVGGSLRALVWVLEEKLL